MAKYLKQDSEKGYIEDSAKIEYLKLNNLRHSILGCMLGDFDEQGFYVISPEIQKELLSMRKFIVNSMDNIEICHGELMLDKPITFMVTFEADRATLSLIERLSFEANLEINSGTYSNVNEFILDEVETAGEIDRNQIYKLWNIGPFGGEVLDISHMSAETLALFSGIVGRYKYLLKANTIMLNKEKELEEVEAEYSVEMLGLLKKYPKLEALVVEEIKTNLKEKKKFIRIDKPYFAKTFNEVVDQAVDGNINALDVNELHAFEEEQKVILQTRNMKMQDKLDVKINTALEEESNVIDLSEEFELERTHRKISLNTNGVENYKSVGELEEEFKSAEDRITNESRTNGINYVRDKQKNSSLASALVYALIDGIAKYIPPRELFGEESRAELGEVVEDKKEEAKTPASDIQTNKQDNKNAAANKDKNKGAEVKKPAPAKPTVKKPSAAKGTEKKGPTKGATTNVNNGGNYRAGGYISKYVTGKQPSVEQAPSFGGVTRTPKQTNSNDLTEVSLSSDLIQSFESRYETNQNINLINKAANNKTYTNQNDNTLGY